MSSALVIPAVLAAAAAAAVALAPAAGAEPPSIGCDKGCSADDAAPKPRPAKKPVRQQSVQDVPTGWLNESLWARPGPSGLSPIGAGPKPPIMAMD